MKRLRLLIYALLLVFAVSAGAQEGVRQWEADAQHVISSAKITDQNEAMEAFSRGNGKGIFIVHLWARSLAMDEPLQQEERKRERRMEVNSVRERAFSQMPAFPRNSVRNLYDNFFAFSAEVTPEELQLLIDNPAVRSIEPVFILHTMLAQGIPLMGGSTYRSQYNGQGLSVAVCDTGINYNHAHLGGGGFPNSKVIGGYDFGQNDGDPMDGNGHGTACAGIVAGALATSNDYVGGVAYNAKLYALKITDTPTGRLAYTSDMAEAWDWCVTHQNDDPSNPIMIITTSFGGGRYVDYCDAAAGSLASAAANAKAAGITLFVASGNEFYCDALASPACISHVISVGAVYDASLGTYQWCVGAGSCIPNQGIPSTCSIGTYAVNDTTSADKVTSYSNSASFLSLIAPSHNAYTIGLGTSSFVASFGGTSAACPYAAGAAAALQSAAKAIKASWLTPDQVKYYLTGFGDVITDDKNGISKPRVNLRASIGALSASPISSKRNLAPIISLLLSDETTNTIQNGDFEYGLTAWSEYSSNGYEVITNNLPAATHSGSYAAWLAGADNETSYIRQWVNVPSSSPYLTYYHWIASDESICTNDFGYVRINGTNINTFGFCSSTNTGGWVPRSINLSGYTGQDVLLEFLSVTNSITNSNWFIDDVFLQPTALMESGFSTDMKSSGGASSIAKPKVK